MIWRDDRAKVINPHRGIMHNAYSKFVDMPLSWPEIRTRATTFQSRWKDAASEQAESQTFWGEFLSIFGVDRKRVALYEKQVNLKHGKKLSRGRIDLFWPGQLLVEMKSAGQDLDRAFEQAADYFDALRVNRDLPRYILVSDFQRFRLFDLHEGIEHPEFRLNELADRIGVFGFIAGYQTQVIRPQDPVNIKAAEQMGKLHDALKASGYEGHALEVLLVRLLFCLFADDTGIFQPAQSFRDWVETETGEDGADLGAKLTELFDVLNTAEAKRQTTQKETFKAFPYINGKLFDEFLRPPAFTGKMRELLLDATALDWAKISPAIFGALFQSIMDNVARRNLGAHYTSEENILKLIKPLFLDDLWAEFEKVKNNAAKLKEFHSKVRHLKFLDPACGCGNFLVITYRELRKLELEILRTVHGGPGSRYLDVHEQIQVNVDQFFGIEIEEFPAQIAQVALWLVDHQMNVEVGKEFGSYYARIPLVTTPKIVHGNALRIDWNEVLPAQQCSYVLGNPPFVGKQHQSAEQKSDVESIFSELKGGGVLDLVAAWYVLSVRYALFGSTWIRNHAHNRVSGSDQFDVSNSAIRFAFVSTNSITQGEQVCVLWGWLLAHGVSIQFAHRTFQWSNDASGKAAVHCVILGLAVLADDATRQRRLFDYEDIKGAAKEISATNINPYLVDAPSVVLPSRRVPICNLPTISFGSMPNDGGGLLLNQDERDELLEKEPAASAWVRPFVGADEFLNNSGRWCLWLKDCPPATLAKLKEVLRRVEIVKRHRQSSSRATTKALASTPTLFGEDRQGEAETLVIPAHSSENRDFIPMGYFSAEYIVGNANFMIANATLYEFGVLSSTMHNAWVRYTCGRLESRYRYSAGIVYNNFPWPDVLTKPATSQSAKEKAIVEKIEHCAQAVLDARAAHPGSSLADLYDPLTMPPNLVKAHQALDAAVDAAYYHAHVTDGAKKSWKSDAERVAFLFTLYQKFTSLLPSDAPAKAKRARKKATA